MTRDERKAFLQQQGILPPDDDISSMQDAAHSVATQEAPSGTSAASIGGALAEAGRAYASGMGASIPEIKPANPEDPKEKLKKLVTPELLQQLRARAGIPQ